MNQEAKQQWVNALRNGDYQQGKNRLRNGDLFCCLGVLCDIHAKAGFGTWHQNKDGEFYYASQSAPATALILPLPVQKWAGVSDDPLIDWMSLSAYNDGLVDEDYSFAEIADLIEEYL